MFLGGAPPPPKPRCRFEAKSCLSACTKTVKTAHKCTSVGPPISSPMAWTHTVVNMRKYFCTLLPLSAELADLIQFSQSPPRWTRWTRDRAQCALLDTGWQCGGAVRCSRRRTEILKVCNGGDSYNKLSLLSKLAIIQNTYIIDYTKKQTLLTKYLIYILRL